MPFWVILQNIRPKTETNGKPMGNQRMVSRCRSRDENVSRRLWRNHSHCHWTQQRGHRWGRLRGEGRWKLGNLEAQNSPSLEVPVDWILSRPGFLGWVWVPWKPPAGWNRMFFLSSCCTWHWIYRNRMQQDNEMSHILQIKRRHVWK